VPVPPPMPAVTNTIAPAQMIADFVDHLFGRSAPDIRLGAGAETSVTCRPSG